MSRPVLPLWGFVIVVTAVIVVTLFRPLPVKNMKPTLESVLQGACPKIQDELTKIPPTLITTKARRMGDWGDAIPQEILDVHQKKTGWIQAWNVHSDSPNSNWLNFGLVIGGRPVGLNCDLCPFTMSIISRIQGVAVGGFSWLRPHSHIDKHTDYLTDTNESVHLGLIVPHGECFLSVYEDNKTVTTYEEANGEVVRFFSRKPHWAMNFSNTDRSILYLDVEVEND